MSCMDPLTTRYHYRLLRQAWGHITTCISAGPQQQLCSFSVAGSGCFKEGRLPVAVLGMHACPAAQEQLDSCWLAGVGCQVEGRCAILQAGSLHHADCIAALQAELNLKARQCARWSVPLLWLTSTTA